MDESFWDFYWETRLGFLQGQGKGMAIQAASRILRSSAKPARVLELGCGEGQILGSLLEAHHHQVRAEDSLGVDRDRLALQKAHHDYPTLQFQQGSFTDPDFLSSLGQFDLILLVNALHHVFSDAYDEELGEINIFDGKQAVRETFQRIKSCLSPGGQILLFDGIEPPGDSTTWVEFRLLTAKARENFDQFVHEYRSLRIHSQHGSSPQAVQLSRRDFTRYVTKLIFVGKPLWQREQQESYQYFTQTEFEHLFSQNGLQIRQLETLSVDHPRWQDQIEILTPGIDFPEEHVLMVGKC